MFRQGYIYRLCPTAEWQVISSGKYFPWSEVDDQDGFFHLSAPNQVLETAKKYYADHHDLTAVGCPEEAPSALLKWEPSRNGLLFPHIYGDVRIDWFDHALLLRRHEDTYTPLKGH